MKKFLTLMAAAAIAMPAIYAQAPEQQGNPESMVITFTDGTTKKHRISEIDHIHFEWSQTPDIPVDPTLEPTTGPYSVGDYYCDGTAQGIVVTVDRTGSYGTMVQLVEMPDLTWGPMDVITNAWDTENGQANMDVVRTFDATFETYPAFAACVALGEGWYLPAQKELQTMRGLLPEINATLAARGLPVIDSNKVYWSSTEADSFSDAMAFAADMDMSGMFGYQKGVAMPVRAFRTFGDMPEPRYVVGKVITEGGISGMVCWVSEDGEYARVISLTQGNAVWGPVNDAVGASSRFDGEANQAAIAAADLSQYPAFNVCASLGEGWYLPSLEELKQVMAKAAEINTAMTEAGGMTLADTYYWTSTEFDNDAPNSAYCVLTTDGSELGSSKGAVRRVLPMAIVGERPSGVITYAVGDVFKDGDQIVGIVCSIEGDGSHGSIIALQNYTETGRINAMWDHRADKDQYSVIGATSTTDGRENLAAARVSDPELANMAAFRVCAALGEGWYLPAVSEMQTVYTNKTTLNEALNANGGKALDNNDYWTSTEGSAQPLERATSFNMKDGSTFDYRKYMYLLVRPMRRF